MVRQPQQKAYSLAHACRLLGISRSGFYEARKRAEAPASVCPITVQLKALFAARRGCYGSRPMRDALRIKDITNYILRFYNDARLRSTLGDLPPNQYERQFAVQPLRYPELVDHDTTTTLR